MKRPILILPLMALLFLQACSNNGDQVIIETGTLEATEVTVSSLAGGTVQSILVQEGDHVSVGDTVAVVDAAEWKYQLLQAEANVRAAEAQYKLAREGARQEDVLQAKANYESAKSDLQRMEELFKTRSISEKQLEDMRTRYTLAEQTWEKMKKGSRQEEIELARARRDQAAAQMNQVRKKIDDCTLTSPLEGIVINKFVEAGELVIPGSSVFRIADLRQLHIHVYVAETVLPRILLGQKAVVSIDAFEDRSFDGKVVYISPTAEFTPKNIQTKDERVKLVFAVKITVENPEGILKAGLPADVTLNLEAGD